MTYQHSSVHIVKIVDVMKNGDTSTWYVGPYGHTRAGQTAHSLEVQAREYTEFESRECTVEDLFSDDDCLRVADYDRAARGSLK